MDTWSSLPFAVNVMLNLSIVCGNGDFVIQLGSFFRVSSLWLPYNVSRVGKGYIHDCDRCDYERYGLMRK